MKVVSIRLCAGAIGSGRSFAEIGPSSAAGVAVLLGRALQSRSLRPRNGCFEGVQFSDPGGGIDLDIRGHAARDAANPELRHA